MKPTKTSDDRERRFRPPQEFRLAGGGDKPSMIVGSAVVYDSFSEDLGFVEVIKPGAFTESLRDFGLEALVNHNMEKLLGKTKSGTLRVNDGPKSLDVEIDIPDTSYGRDTVVSIERKDMDGMSFGFECEADEWSQTSDGKILRTIKKARIFDVSPVFDPAYLATTLSLRSKNALSVMKGSLEPFKLKLELREKIYRR